MAKTYNELNDLVAKQEKIILSQQRTIDTLVNSLNSKEDKITETNKLESDLVDDTNQINKFVTEEDKTSWNGKSVVVANPTLAGTEGALEGIEIGGTKYKIGGGDKLYQHNTMYEIQSGKYRIYISYISKSISSESLPQLLYRMSGNKYDNGLFVANGYETDSSLSTITGFIQSIYAESSSTIVAYKFINSNFSITGFKTISYLNVSITDVVEEL